ncbi:MAG: UDP-N-acetylglucosamine 1-carboxyvinyltransferase [Chloroflexota bacterium]|nr:UDP-N-acetylglucosamine 1-carboxyvinyltransferase [Chloroflexota bacterium]
MSISIPVRSANGASTTPERAIRIVGGTPLRGDVTIGGSKNAALPALAATLLTSDECTLQNVPDLADIHNMVLLLRSLGAEVDVDRQRRRVRVRAASITRFAAPPELVAKMRASFLVAGPLLTRFGTMTAATPGGCKLGARPVDVDVRGFRQMGASLNFIADEGGGTTIVGTTEGLRGKQLYMDYPSHTGTENLLMAATLASGKTLIVNAASEPEIVHLGNMLIRMGARIHGLGTPTIVVEGVDRLHGVSEAILPDRLEAGTFAIGSVVTGGEVRLLNIRVPDMVPLTAKLREAGAEVWTNEGEMLVRARGPLRAVDVQTLPFPGFPTDLQAAFAVLMTQADGRSKLHERVFEDRLRYTDQLRTMGAKIDVPRYALVVDGGTDAASDVLYGPRAEIHGPTPLHGAHVRCLDIRAGAGMVLAGLIANGETVVSDVFHLDRGYEALVPKLQHLGAQITETTVDGDAPA